MQTSVRPGASKSATPASDVTEPPSARPPSGPVPLLLLKAMRPLQWSKNVLLFAGLLFALKFTDPTSVVKALAGFALFCIFSSNVYLINDLRDRERDRLNPRTAKRPIASGALKPATTVADVIIILRVAFKLSFLLNPWFAFAAAIYIAKAFAY